MSETLTLIHVLAAERPVGPSVTTRSTVRAGMPAIGGQLWFSGPDGRRRPVAIEQMVHSQRWSTIVFSGAPRDLELITTGTYVHAQSMASHPVGAPA